MGAVRETGKLLWTECLAGLLLMAWPIAARAGGTCEAEGEEDLKVVRALKTWRAAGAKAQPAVLQALCAESYPLRDVAKVWLVVRVP